MQESTKITGKQIRFPYYDKRNILLVILILSALIVSFISREYSPGDEDAYRPKTYLSD